MLFALYGRSVNTKKMRYLNANRPSWQLIWYHKSLFKQLNMAHYLSLPKRGRRQVLF